MKRCEELLFVLLLILVVVAVFGGKTQRCNRCGQEMSYSERGDVQICPSGCPPVLKESE